MWETSALQPSDPRSDPAVTVVGLSGGVDSAVAALLSLRSSPRVVGVTLVTPGAKPEQAAAICEELGIEHRAIDAHELFEHRVVREFVDDWARGLTPNPCIECNPRVKFELLARVADELGGARIVTGHYARIRIAGDEWHLLRASDRSRDQSYVLHRLPQAVLGRLLLPLGEMSKTEVRETAAAAGLSVADRESSQDVCFTPDVGALISERRPEALQPGPIVDTRGRELGRHAGLARYTVGQRRGLGIGGPEGPFFVLRIDAAHNRLVVGSERDLWVDRTEVKRVHMVGNAPDGPFEASVMTRYRGTETPATVEHMGSRATIRFHRPHRAPAPGQSAVFYQEDRCLGGGVIVWPQT